MSHIQQNTMRFHGIHYLFNDTLSGCLNTQQFLHLNYMICFCVPEINSLNTQNLFQSISLRIYESFILSIMILILLQFGYYYLSYILQSF